MHSLCTRNSAREKLPHSMPSPGASMLHRSIHTLSPMPTGSTCGAAAAAALPDQRASQSPAVPAGVPGQEQRRRHPAAQPARRAAARPTAQTCIVVSGGVGVLNACPAALPGQVAHAAVSALLTRTTRATSYTSLWALSAFLARR